MAMVSAALPNPEALHLPLCRGPRYRISLTPIPTAQRHLSELEVLWSAASFTDIHVRSQDKSQQKSSEQ